jgi:adenylate cyclase
MNDFHNNGRERRLLGRRGEGRALLEPLTRGFRIGECLIVPMLGRIGRPDGECHVEPHAMDVLVELARHAGDTISHNALILSVWGHPHVTDYVLSRCISMLRHALGDNIDQPRFIETIPKRGYRLIAPVILSKPLLVDAKVSPSIAVLPFLNLSGSPADEYLADGITEMLIASLSCLSSLRIISRTSSMHYKGTQSLLSEIARELSVSRVIEGSVLRSARQLRVIVQLIDPATDMHLFTRTYTAELDVDLQLHNDVVRTIAEDILASLTVTGTLQRLK